MILMVAITVVSKSSNGFSIQNITVKSIDMKEIIKKMDSELGWSVNRDDCEVFYYNAKGKNWLSVGRRTGRGWTRISTFVKGWDKYASPSWVKKVKSLRK